MCKGGVADTCAAKLTLGLIGERVKEWHKEQGEWQRSVVFCQRNGVIWQRSVVICLRSTLKCCRSAVISRQ